MDILIVLAWFVASIGFLVSLVLFFIAKIMKKETKKLKVSTFSFLAVAVAFFVISILLDSTGYKPTDAAIKASIDTEKNQANEEQLVTGIEVKIELASNIEEINEATILANITNQTTKTFSGYVELVGGQAKYWRIDIESLPPGETIQRQTKVNYIKPNSEVFTKYEARGTLRDANHKSAYEYTIFYNPEGTKVFYVQTETVSKESVVEIIKELYAKYGEQLVHVAIYDKTQSIKEGEMPEESPKADYFKAGNIITIYENGKAESFTLDTN